MRLIKVVLISFILSGCTTNFSTVDFRYTNLAHMNYRDAMTNVSIAPEALIFDLSEAFRNNGANILERTKVNYILVENNDGQKCWNANNEIWQKEFNAYRINNYFDYKFIDREQPFTSRQIDNKCTFFTSSPNPAADSWLLKVELPPLSASSIVYQPNINSFFVFGQNKMYQGFSKSYTQEQVGISVSSRLYIYAWKLPGSQTTSVYILAKPVSGQIEAKDGNSIGWTWWQVTNGYSEQQTVRNYISLILEYDRKKTVE